MKKEKKFWETKIFKAISMIVILALCATCSILIYNHTPRRKAEGPDNKIKYVFLFIGDGMSTTQTELTEMYINQVEGNAFDSQKQLSYTKFDTVGLRKNASGDNFVTDSSASASVLASGKLIANGSVNIDLDGNKTEPITYKLKNKLGMKIGIITTMGINHATPAGFYAYSNSRDNYEEIALQIPDTGFDYFAGGGILSSNDEITSKISNAGYTIVSDQESFDNMNNSSKYVVLSPILNSSSTINFGMDQKEEEWGLDDFVKKGIDILDNNKGFFMMAEAGMIDYAGHNNDARSVISEVQELDKAVLVAKEFADKHPGEVLILVTGDHETGGLALGTNVNYQALQTQKLSYVDLIDYGNSVRNNGISLSDVINYITVNCGISLESGTENYNKVVDAYNRLSSDPLALEVAVVNIKNAEAGVSYTTGQHTGVTIPVYAYGDKDKYFSGVYNSEVFNTKLRTLLNAQ